MDMWVILTLWAVTLAGILAVLKLLAKIEHLESRLDSIDSSLENLADDGSDAELPPVCLDPNCRVRHASR